MKYRYLMFCVFLIGLPAFAGTLQPFNAKYTIEVDQEVVAHTSVSLNRSGRDGWKYRTYSKPTGWFVSIMGISVTETSYLENLGDKLRVSEYRYSRTGKSKRIHLLFDWENMSVTNSINGNEWSMDIPEGTTDKLSINLELMTNVDNQTSQISFPVADGGKLKYYNFKKIGNEQIETSLGKLNTVKMKRKKRGRKNKAATFWLAEELGFLPVRVERRNKEGKLTVMNIQSLN